MTTKMSIKKSQLKEFIRDVPDFPQEGILFKDITTLLSHPEAFKKSIDLLARQFKGKNVDVIVGVESRGFIFGAPLAYKMGASFVPVRKKGKLPYKTKSVTYELEYGSDTLEVHEDAIPKGANVLIVDDLLATGGTVQAVVDLVQKQTSNIVGVAFLIELKFLKGKSKIQDMGDFDIYSLIKY